MWSDLLLWIVLVILILIVLCFWCKNRKDCNKSRRRRRNRRKQEDKPCEQQYAYDQHQPAPPCSAGQGACYQGSSTTTYGATY